MEETKRIKELEQAYLYELSSGKDTANKRAAIRAFDNWYREVVILFSKYFDDNNADYLYIKNQCLAVNGYEKENIYSDIQARVAMLVSKIESINSEKIISNHHEVSHNTMEQEKVYSIFISSTYSDLMEERLKAMNTIVSMGHLPVGMELFPAAPIAAFEYIKKLIDKSDYYLLLLAGKYGTIIEEEGKSYTQMEYEYAVSKGVPVIFLTYSDVDNLSNSKCEKDAKTIKLLEKFREEASKGRLRQTWSNLDELATKIMKSLQETIRISPRTGWVRADTVHFDNRRVDPGTDYENVKIKLNYKPDHLIFASSLDIALLPQSITIRELMILIGETLRIPKTEDAIDEVIIKKYPELSDNSLTAIKKALIKYDLVEVQQIKMDGDGIYTAWVLSNKGFKLWSEL